MGGNETSHVMRWLETGNEFLIPMGGNEYTTTAQLAGDTPCS